MNERTILLVDDEADLVTTMVERLSLRGLHAEGALSGAEAVERLRAGGVAAVVLDIKMKGMDGLEVLRCIRDQHPAVPVIMLSGLGTIQDGRECIDAGARDYLTKPVALEDLIERIQEAIEVEGDEP